MIGEAVVVSNPDLLPHFFTLIKQHGALLAKGRILGIQFETLFTDNLYTRLGAHGVEMAMLLRRGFEEKGFTPFIDSPTNQQFFSLPNEVIDRLLKVATFEYWGPRGKTESLVRFVTDWATTPEDIAALIENL